MVVGFNINRLRFLLALYGMKEGDLLTILNDGLKRKYTCEQVFTHEIDLKVLKKIDKVFNKGLNYYVDPAPIQVGESMSVFFRKKNLGEMLNFTSKKVVNDFESLKNYLASLDKLSNVRTEVTLPHCTQRTSPRVAAARVRELIYPEKEAKTPRDFLKGLIYTLSKCGVLVFEYLEAPNKKEKANIDGFFLKPNFIVLKRHSYFKREIFTLLHEVGHCVLDVEEVESLNSQQMDYTTMSKTERWCNDFAFYFLVGKYADEFMGIDKADGTNDYQFPLFEKISQECHISRRALFTRLFYDGKMSQPDYENVLRDLDEQFSQWLEKKKVLGASSEEGFKKRISAPKPIYSPMFLSTLSVALNDGVVRPAELYRMNIPSKVVEGLRQWL